MGGRSFLMPTCLYNAGQVTVLHGKALIILRRGSSFFDSTAVDSGCRACYYVYTYLDTMLM